VFDESNKEEYWLTTLGPFAHEVTQILKIKNINQTPVAFKVRFPADVYGIPHSRLT